MRTLVVLSTFFIWAIGVKAAELVMPKTVSVTEKEVSIESDGYKLFGTMNIPETKKNLSVLLLIAGSGPTDRDGNQPNLTNNSFNYLATDLAQNEIATLRYDKRGIAKSAVPGFSNADVIFDDYVNDAVEWIKYLKTQNKFAKIYVAGLSEGSLIGMLAAHRAGADGFISLNGPGRPADEIIINQITKQGTPHEVIDQVKSIIVKIKLGEEVKEVPAYLMGLFHPDLQPYMRTWFSYNPKLELGKLNVPVLIVQGENDIQVEVEDANKLKEGSPNAEFNIIAGMNHILKEADVDPQLNLATYNNPELPIKNELVKIITQFIQ